MVCMAQAARSQQGVSNQSQAFRFGRQFNGSARFTERSKVIVASRVSSGLACSPQFGFDPTKGIMGCAHFCTKRGASGFFDRIPALNGAVVG